MIYKKASITVLVFAFVLALAQCSSETPNPKTEYKKNEIRVMGGFNPYEYSLNMPLEERLNKAVLRKDKKVIVAIIRDIPEALTMEYNGMTALHYASYLGYPEIVKLLLENGADVNIRDKDGESPLSNARNAETVKVLLAHDADVNLKGESGKTPLFRHVESGAKADIVELLIAAGSDVNARCHQNNDDTVQHTAARRGDTAAVRLLLKNGTDISAKNNYGAIPIHYSAAERHSEVTKLLIESGSPVNENFLGGWTALHFLAKNGDIENVKLILSKKANVSPMLRGFCASDRLTPLGIAASNGHADIIKLLIAHGADPKKELGGRYSLLESIQSSGYEDVIEIIIAAGVAMRPPPSPNIIEDGWTEHPVSGICPSYEDE